MPQVFGADQLSLVNFSSLWIEAAASGKDIEKATHPQVAAEARARGLVPLRMGLDPIWHHPETGEWITLTPSHGTSGLYKRVKNDQAALRRRYPTPEEAARASRSDEQKAADSAAAAEATRSKKQQAVDAAKRRRDQEASIAFKKENAPFRNMNEIQRAFDTRGDKAREARPDETVDQFAERLRQAGPDIRRQLHRVVFPERYP